MPYLFSTGGNDKALFQWKYVVDDEVAEEEAFGEKNEEELKEAGNGEDLGMFEMQDVGEGTEKMAVSQFEGQVQHMWPSNYKRPKNAVILESLKFAQGAVPDENLQLRYVHGYRGFDTRNNLKYTKSADGEIVYTAAGLGIVSDFS